MIIVSNRNAIIYRIREYLKYMRHLQAFCVENSFHQGSTGTWSDNISKSETVTGRKKLLS